MLLDRIHNVWLATFASSNGWRAVKRLRRQARAFGFSRERSFFWDESGLDADFAKAFERRLRKGIRGFGYWCWKPQVVLQTLRKMSDGDVLLYVDAGCHLNPSGRERFCDYLDAVSRTNLLVFQYRVPSANPRGDFEGHFNVESQWTKGDVLDFFDVRNEGRILRSGQISGGIVLIRKCAETVRFYEKIVGIFKEHFNLTDDSPSCASSLPDFRGNRHDQSVFSIMCKLVGYDVHSLSACEFSPYNLSISARMQRGVCRSWDEMKGYPIWAKCDISYGWRAWIPHWVKHVGWWMLNLIYKLTGIRFVT